MSDRTDTPAPPRAPARPRGLPAYRPVRSPLVSMGPSLEDARRRRRARRNAILLTVAATCFLAALTWVIVLLGQEVSSPEAVSDPATRPLPPVGEPEPTALARALVDGEDQPLRLQLPIARPAVTAIGYDVYEDPDALTLQPEGARANRSWAQRTADRFLSTRPVNDLRWYRLHGRASEPTMVVVGAGVETDAYSPIEGTVLAIADYEIDGEVHGAVIQLQPVGDADTMVVVRGLDAAPKLAVGQSVSAGTTLLGTVHDHEGVLDRPLAQYTADEGAGIDMYVVDRAASQVGARGLS